MTLEECAVRMSISAIEILVNEYEQHPDRNITREERIRNIQLADYSDRETLERTTLISNENKSFLEEHLRDVFGECAMPVTHVLTKLFLEQYVSVAKVFDR